jgi:hypothetical protein
MAVLNVFFASALASFHVLGESRRKLVIQILGGTRDAQFGGQALFPL